MNQFRLSTDILSPLRSDISLNDTSVLSFGNISGTPELGREINSSKYDFTEKDSTIDSFCKKTMKESAAAFDMIVDDIKKESNKNAEREERFKESYTMLKNSMDELFYKASHASVLSPISNDAFFENVDEIEEMSAEKITDTVRDIPQNLKNNWEKIGSTKPKISSQNLSRKSRNKEDSGVTNRKKESNRQSKDVYSLKESTENSKHCKSKTYLEKEIGGKEGSSACDLQKPRSSKTISSSTQTYEHLEKAGANGKETLNSFYSHKQRKTAVSNSKPATANKNLSIEKSIQIAISMEMDSLRRFMLQQNLCLRKDLLKLEETAKKQSEVTGYLFSVIEGLMEENKKLISKIN